MASLATFAGPLPAFALLGLARLAPVLPAAGVALLLALVADDLLADDLDAVLFAPELFAAVLFAPELFAPELFAVVRLAAVLVAADFAVAGLAAALVVRGLAGAFEPEPPRLACGISLSLV